MNPALHPLVVQAYALPDCLTAWACCVPPIHPQGFGDAQSGIASIEWAIGTEPLASDIKVCRLAVCVAARVACMHHIARHHLCLALTPRFAPAVAQPFTQVEDGAAGNVLRTWSPSGSMALSAPKAAYHTLRVTNGVGAVTTAVSPGIRFVSSGLDGSFLCGNVPAVGDDAHDDSASGRRHLLKEQAAMVASAVAPSGRIQPYRQGMHPWFLPLTLGALHHEYIVDTVASVPQAGSITTRMQVGLTRLDRWDAGRAHRLVRMHIQPGYAGADRAGAPLDLSHLKLSHSPVYFWQASDGRIKSILHHPEESNSALGNKRQLISQLQIIASPAASSAAHRRELGSKGVSSDGEASEGERSEWQGSRGETQWTQVEHDMSGMAVSTYSKRRGLLGRYLYEKSSLWSAPTADRDAAFVQLANLSAIVDGRTGVVRQLDVSMTIEMSKDDEQLESLQSLDIRRVVEALPTEPAVVRWSLMAEASRARSARALGEWDADDHLATYTSAGLLHSHKADPRRSMREREENAKLAVAAAKKLGLSHELELVDYDERPARLTCDRGWARVLNQRLTKCLSSITEQTMGCVRVVQQLATACPDGSGVSVVAALREALLHTPVCKTNGASCRGLVNALSAIDTPGSQKALAELVRSESWSAYAGPSLTIALSRLSRPEPALLEALSDRLQDTHHPVHPTHAADGPAVSLLLGAAALSSRASAMDSAAALHLASKVRSAVEDNLRRAREQDATFDQAVRRPILELAEAAWGHTSQTVREFHAREVAGMDHEAMEWEVAHGRYEHHLEQAKQRYIAHHMASRGGYSTSFEEHANNNLVTAVRALRNLKNSSCTLHAAELLQHRCHAVQTAAAEAITHNGGEHAQPLLLGALASQLDDGGSGHKAAPDLTNRSVEGLLALDKPLSADGLDTVVRLLLQRKLHVPARSSHSEMGACVESSVAECNPAHHTRQSGECLEQCKSTCAIDDGLTVGLRKLIRVAWKSNSSLRPQVIRSIYSHFHTAHASHKELHRRHLAYLQTVGEPMVDPYAEYARAARALPKQVADRATHRRLNHVQRAQDGADTTAAFPNTDWNNWDDTWHPIFLDVVLSHAPVSKYGFVGNDELFGSYGGAGAYYSLALNNAITVKLGIVSGKVRPQPCRPASPPPHLPVSPRTRPPRVCDTPPRPPSHDDGVWLSSVDGCRLLRRS